MTIFTSGHRFYSTGWHKKKTTEPNKTWIPTAVLPLSTQFFSTVQTDPVSKPQKKYELKKLLVREKFKFGWRFSQNSQMLGSAPVTAIPKSLFFLHFWENCDIRWCKNTQQIDPYPRKVIKVAWIDGVGFKRLFGDFLVEQMPRF